MMDIVKWLREYGWRNGTKTCGDRHDEAADYIERLRAWSDHLMDSGIILADAVMNVRKNGYVLPAQLHNATVNPLDLFLEEKSRRATLKEGE